MKPKLSLSSLSFRRPSFSAPSTSLPLPTTPGSSSPPIVIPRHPLTGELSMEMERTLPSQIPGFSSFSQYSPSERVPSPLTLDELDETESISSELETPREERNPSPLSSTYHPPSSLSYFNLSKTEFHLPSPSASSLSRINLLQRENEPRSHFSSWGTSLANTSRYELSLNGDEDGRETGRSTPRSRHSYFSRRSRQSRDSTSSMQGSQNKENRNQNRCSFSSSSSASSSRPRLLRSSTTSAIHQADRITCQEFLDSRPHKFRHSALEESQVPESSVFEMSSKLAEDRNGLGDVGTTA